MPRQSGIRRKFEYCICTNPSRYPSRLSLSAVHGNFFNTEPLPEFGDPSKMVIRIGTPKLSGVARRHLDPNNLAYHQADHTPRPGAQRDANANFGSHQTAYPALEPRSNRRGT